MWKKTVSTSPTQESVHKGAGLDLAQRGDPGTSCAPKKGPCGITKHHAPRRLNACWCAPRRVPRTSPATAWPKEKIPFTEPKPPVSQAKCSNRSRSFFPPAQTSKKVQHGLCCVQWWPVGFFSLFEGRQLRDPQGAFRVNGPTARRKKPPLLI